MEDMSTMEKVIEVCEKEIEELEKFNEFTDKRGTYYYEQKMESLNEVMKPRVYLKEEIELRKKFLNLYKRCQAANIDLTQDIYFLDNVYLSFWIRPGSLAVGFYLNDDSWFYENYMSSHSDLNTWTTDLIIQTFDDILICANNDDFYCNTMESCVRSIDNSNRELTVKDFDRKFEAIKQILNYIDENGYYSKVTKRVKNLMNSYFQNMFDANEEGY